MNASEKRNPAWFKAIMALIVPAVIAETKRRRGINDEKAFLLFYSSKVYSVLETESAKLWHLSPKALVELLDMETAGGEIVFPEEA